MKHVCVAARIDDGEALCQQYPAYWPIEHRGSTEQAPGALGLDATPQRDTRRT